MSEALSLSPSQQVTGHVKWKSPSNIAIVKYWGKHGVQLPRNASLSFTLSAAHTVTSVQYKSKEADGKVSVHFLFEGVENEAFASKIITFLQSLVADMPYLAQLHFDIESSNSFPHSSGIASSASAMSALALCLCSIEHDLFDSLPDVDRYIHKASHLARLGSGSASRSVLPQIGIWGAHPAAPGSSDQYAVGLDGVHEVFTTYHDDILIINAGEKAVSSRAGHALMEGNPYAAARYTQANDRLQQLITIMKTGDVHAFGKLAEDEAMTLHALMMCSDPSYVLMMPHTLAAIDDIRAYRQHTGHPLYFTLDAGPNLHLLYPDSIAKEASTFIKNNLKKYCQDGLIIRDMVGMGPEKLSS